MISWMFSSRAKARLITPHGDIHATPRVPALSDFPTVGFAIPKGQAEPVLTDVPLPLSGIVTIA